jgi:predicted RNA-binding Zn-ribbon protein involved in translation (DUF1610 family)
MAKSQHHVCLSCDNEFRVIHEVEGETLRVQYCPFCGEGIDAEETYEIEEEEDDR